MEKLVCLKYKIGLRLDQIYRNPEAVQLDDVLNNVFSFAALHCIYFCIPADYGV